ncbi:MAG: Xaa-Pro peptidase family protein [candidate division NC10 bacterium]|nr:Xaa-Pro peptidase family protein [candidate division NC10 bacterium]
MNIEPRTAIVEPSAVDARLIIAASETDANLFYATRFLAPDAFVFVLTPTGEKVLLMSDLEVDRARAQAAVDTVLSIRHFEERAKASGVERPGILDSVCAFLAEREIRTVRVPGSFPIEYGDGLRERGVAVQVRRERLLKTADEVEAISRAMQRTEAAMDAAIGAIREAEAHDGVLRWRGTTLTAERVRRLISMTLIEDGLLSQHTIVACGEAGCDPHNEGSGPLRAGQSIIIDIFPRDEASRYYADITRTVAGQERAFALLRDGADGETIHRAVQAALEGHGFQSGEVSGRMQGFFHGTGHGLGLEVHELPRISKLPTTLRSGNVVTVEPGLYYSGIGGVRIEDVVVVTETGCINLTRYPKDLEV